MLWYVLIGLWCFILGLVASLLTPYHKMLIRRLGSINVMAKKAIGDLRRSIVKDPDNLDIKKYIRLHDAMVFIVCESNLNVTNGKHKVI